MTTKQVLTASVNTRKNKPGAKVKFLTNVVIRLSGRALAFRTLGGAFNAVEALKEFRREPKRWAPQSGFSVEALATYAKVA